MILLTFNILNNKSDFKKNQGLDQSEIRDITVANVGAILRILENHNVKATFFIEVSLVEKTLTLIKKVVSQGHEISLYNDHSTLAEIERAKRTVEVQIDKIVRGIRQMDTRLPVENLKELEFSYISNIESADMLFSLQRLRRSTQISVEQCLSIIQEGISPYTQIPYNKSVFQLFPLKIYEQMIAETLENNDFMIIYLDTSQFTDINKYGFNVPFHQRLNSGRKMEDKIIAIS